VTRKRLMSWVVGGGPQRTGRGRRTWPGRGWPRLVCETARQSTGGGGVSEHPFGPDYTVTLAVLCRLPAAARPSSADLRLEQHGYRVYPQGPYFAPRADGRYLRLPHDPGAAARRDRQVLRPADADALSPV